MRSRSFFAAVVALGYVSFASMQSQQGRVEPAWISIAALFAILGAAWYKSAPPSRGIDRIEPAVRSAARSTATGATLLLGSWIGESGNASLCTTANVGAAMATMGATVSLARIAPGGGLLQPPASTRRLDTTALAAALWGIAVALPLARVVAPDLTNRLDPITIDYATLAASSGALGLIIAASFRVRALRRLELGVADRASAALSLSVVTLAVAIPALILHVATPDRTMSMASVIASLCVQFACISREPTSVAKTMRTVLGIGLLGVPVGLAGVALSLRSPQSTGVLMFAVCGASIVAGLAAPVLARPLGPARSRWLHAIEQANEAALHPDPDVALRDALSAFRTILPGQSESPALFQASPPLALTIDRAGYVHTHEAEAPAHLHEIAVSEPERTVRAEVLRAMEVRRPDLRSLVEWMDARGLLSVTLVRDDDGPVGLLGIPKGKRRSPTNLEEVRAIRVLADRIGALLGVSSALARSRQRELDLRRLADCRAQDIERMQSQLNVQAEKARANVERLAQPIVAKTYSPAATMAYEQIKRMGSFGRSITLITPPGVDPIPWAAVAHLAGPRASGPFAIVHGSFAPEHDIDRWRNPNTSPILLADGGTLAVIDASALPKSVQDFIAASLALRDDASGKSLTNTKIAASFPKTTVELVAEGRLSSILAEWLAGDADGLLQLPPLAMRSEDLRALVLDHLSRKGLQYRGRPVGIDDRALALLMEHSWPGNDVELDDILLRAVLVSSGSRVAREDLLKIGFGG